MLLRSLSEYHFVSTRAVIFDVLTRFADETVVDGLLEIVETHVGDELTRAARALTYVEPRPAVRDAIFNALFKSPEHSEQITEGLASGAPRVAALLAGWIEEASSTERLLRLVRVAVLWSANQTDVKTGATHDGLWRAIANALARADAPTQDALIQRLAGLPEDAPIRSPALFDEVARWVVARRSMSSHELDAAALVRGLTVLHRIGQSGAESGGERGAALLTTLEEILARAPSPAARDVALRLLCARSPSICARYLEGALRLPGADASAASQLTAEQRHPAFVPVLSGLARLPAWAPEASLALADVAGGAGLEALMALVRDPAVSQSVSVRSHLLRALAIGLRDRSLPETVRDDGWAVLRATAGDGTRGLRLRGIARDPEVLAVALDKLLSEEVDVRRAAAFALYVSLHERAPGASWTLSVPLPDAIVKRSRAVLSEEADDETARWLIYGLASEIPLPLLLRDLENPARRGAALYASAVKLASSNDLGITGAHRLRQTLVRATRSKDAKERALAAYGRALIGDVRAWAALRPLAEDPDDQVQIAAARALQRLAYMSGDTRERRIRQLEGLSRLRDKGPSRSFLRSPYTPASADDSDRVLIIRAGSNESVSPSIPTVVWSPKAFPIDVMTAEDGEILLPGLSPGVADVRFGVL